MQLNVRLFGNGRLPAASDESCIEFQVIDEPHWQIYVRDVGRNSESLVTLISSIAGTRSQIWSYEFDYVDSANGLSNEPCVAYLLSPGDIENSVNSREDYLYFFGGRDHGLLKPDVPLLLAERPLGLYMAVGAGNAIMHSSMLGVLRPYIHSEITVSTIFYRGKKLTEWLRIALAQEARVIDEFFSIPHVCLVCNCPVLSDIGLNFGSSLPALTVAADACGFGHHKLEHPIVVSCDVAEKVSAKFNSGYRLEPVFGNSGSLAMLVRRTIESLKPVVSCRSDWAIDPYRTLGAGTSMI